MLAFSRAFSLQIDGKKMVTMVPLADMINHAVPSKVNCSFRFDSSQNGFVIEADRDVSKGEELLYSYGEKPNCEFLLHYGFTVDDNAVEESLQMLITLRNDDPNKELKKCIIKCDGKMFKLHRRFGEDDTIFDMLSFLRFVTAENAVSSEQVKTLRPVSLNAEKKLFEHLAFLC